MGGALWGGAEVTFGQMDWEVLRELSKMVPNWCSAQPLPLKQESALKALGTEGLFLFSSLDTDRDMYISPEEFRPIAEKLTGTRGGWGLGRREPRHCPQLLGGCVCSEQEGCLEEREDCGSWQPWGPPCSDTF